MPSPAAVPASSDRLFRPDDLATAAQAVRTLPIRVEVELSGGRIHAHIYPDTLEVHPGDAVEWNFRYQSGTDVIVQEVSIEIDEKKLFGKTVFRSKSSGYGRHHRQVAGPVQSSADGMTAGYRIHVFDAFKTEVATSEGRIVVEQPVVTTVV